MCGGKLVERHVRHRKTGELETKRTHTIASLGNLLLQSISGHRRNSAVFVAGCQSKDWVCMDPTKGCHWKRVLWTRRRMLRLKATPPRRWLKHLSIVPASSLVDAVERDGGIVRIDTAERRVQRVCMEIGWSKLLMIVRYEKPSRAPVGTSHIVVICVEK